MLNFLEQLVAEWYEFQGYYVRRNVRVGKRSKGGHEGELDVVAFHPGLERLVHIETSMDSLTWNNREEKFKKKFATGRNYIHSLFEGLNLPHPDKIEKIAVLGQASNKNRATVGGGKIQPIAELMADIRRCVAKESDKNVNISEQYVILRSIQFAEYYWRSPRAR